MLVHADSITRRSLKALRPHMAKGIGEVDPSQHVSDLDTAYLAFHAQTQLAQLKVAVAPRDLALDPGAVVERARHLATTVTDALSDAINADAVVALGRSLPARLLDLVDDRARRCLDVLDSASRS